MAHLHPEIDPDGLLEYSVVFTDRSLNHMSQRFQGAMRGISAILREAYGASAVALVPGGGTVAMESVARQFATGRKALVIRNGFFSFRWSQIFDTGAIPSAHTVCKARPVAPGSRQPFAPAPLADVLAAIRSERPAVVCAPHVETAAGIVLPDAYLRAVAEAVHEVGGLFVLDCIASGALWVDLRATGVDVLVSAPQKGWSGTPCAGFVMLGERAMAVLPSTTSTSFAVDLRRWLAIMEAYEKGGHAYHATLPTDGLYRTWQQMQATRDAGFAALRAAQEELGAAVRSLLVARGFPSVAAPGFEAPSVVVSYTTEDAIQNGKAFLAAGLQTAAGVPLQCDEPADFKTFRIGLFGLDKLGNPARTVDSLARALDAIGAR